MARQQDPGYKPLPVWDKWKLNRAIHALRSPFHSVRVAAHREIQKILAGRAGKQRPRDLKARLKANLKARVRKLARPKAARAPRNAGDGKPHRCSCGRSFHSREFFNEHARQHAQEGRQAPARSRQRGRQRPGQPATGRPLLTPRDLKERHRARKQAARTAPAPAARPAPAQNGNAPAARPAPARPVSRAPAPLVPDARPAAPRMAPPLPSQTVGVPRAPRVRRTRIRMPSLGRSR